MPFFLWRKHRNEPGTIECNQSSCTFQAVPHLEEHKISIVVRNQLGEETASNSFNITDRGQRSCRHQIRKYTVYVVVIPVYLFCRTNDLSNIHKFIYYAICSVSPIMCVLLLVSPVVEWYRVSPGVTNTTMSWIIQGNLTQQNLLCQITTDPGNVSEVTVIQVVYGTFSTEIKIGHFRKLFCCPLSVCV